MEINKKDLYKSYLKREFAYVVFMASNETDLSLLPEPITMTERGLMKLCQDKVSVMNVATKPHADSENPEGIASSEPNKNTPQEEAAPVKKTSTKRTAKKTTVK